MDDLRIRLSALRFPVPTDNEGAVLVSIAAAEHHNGLVDAILAGQGGLTEAAKALPEFCGACDGCGWHEGGEVLKAECGQCGGTGVVPVSP